MLTNQSLAGNRLQVVLKAQTAQFQKQLFYVLKKTNRKNVHQLRITIRRIRALLWLAEYGSPHSSFARLTAKLQRLGHRLGKLRELDVAIQNAKRFHLNHDRLKKMRNSERCHLKRKVSYKHCLKISLRLERAIEDIADKSDLNVELGLIALKNKYRHRALRNLKYERDYHALRIITKKIRYSLETLYKPATPLKAVQEELGRGRDIETLQKFIGERRKLRAEKNSHYKKARLLARQAVGFVENKIKYANEDRDRLLRSLL